MREGAVVRRRAEILTRLEDDEAFLLDPRTLRLRLLNVTGLEVWRRLDGRRDVAAVAHEVARLHPDVDPASVTADVERFVDDLVEAGLAEVVARE